MGAFSLHSVRARGTAASHVARIPLRKRTALSAGALPARSVRARNSPVILALPPPEAVAKRGAEVLRVGAAMLETHAVEMREIAGMTREQVLVGMAEQNPSRGQA